MNARGFAIAACFTLAGGAAVASTPVVDRVDGLMRDLVSRNLFQGAVVVGTGGRIDYAAGFGFAEIERRVPCTPDTRTDGASMAKTVHHLRSVAEMEAFLKSVKSEAQRS